LVHSEYGQVLRRHLLHLKGDGHIKINIKINLCQMPVN
jgi:hypothetical protein